MTVTKSKLSKGGDTEGTEVMVTDHEKSLVVTDPAASGLIIGDVDVDDTGVPFIGIANGTSSSVQEFGFGSTVLGKKVLLALAKNLKNKAGAKQYEEEPELFSHDMIILRSQKMFKELVPFGSDIIPKRFMSVQEATEAGELVILRGKGATYTPVLCILCLVASAAVDKALEDPDDDTAAELFNIIDTDGRAWAVGNWELQKTAYGLLGQDIFRKNAVLSKQPADGYGLRKYVWRVGTVEKPIPSGDGVYLSPYAMSSKELSTEYVDALLEKIPGL